MYIFRFSVEEKWQPEAQTGSFLNIQARTVRQEHILNEERNLWETIQLETWRLQLIFTD